MSEGMQDLKIEWQILHVTFEEYEKYSLFIKLAGLAVCLIYLSSAMHGFSALILLTILWLMEAVWKTFQSRIADRLIQIEDSIKGDTNQPAYSLYSPWQGSRLPIDALLRSYLQNGLRPTVLFPHILYILLIFFSAILY